MAERWETARRPPQAPMTPRNRRRWLLVAGVGVSWVLLLALTGSVLGATVLLLLLAALGFGCVLSLRSLGIDAGHPWLRQFAARRWRDGYDGPPAGFPAGPPHAGARSGFGPPRGAPLPAAAGFTPAAPAPPPAWHEPDSAFGDARTFSYAHAGSTRIEAAGPGHATSPPTVTEACGPIIPTLKLVTGDRVTQTRVSGARAGRGAVDLVLPEVPTVSREHAKFTFTDGQWWVSNLGRNGLTLNGAPVLDGGYAIRDGDSIQWGRRPDAPVSRIEIG